MDFDSILGEIGEFGKFQKIRLILLCIPASFLCVFCNYALVFMQLTPPHWCNGSDLTTISTVMEQKITNSSAENCILHTKFSDLQMNETCPNEMTMRSSRPFRVSTGFPNRKFSHNLCEKGWEFDDSDKTETIVTRWNFYCQNAYYKELTVTIAQVGSITGVLLFSQIQDIFGRRPAFFSCLTLYIISSLSSLFVPCYSGFVFLRFCAAFSSVPAFQIPFIIALELVGPSKRTLVTNVMAIAFSLSMAIFGILAYFSSNWFQVGLITAVPFLALYVYWWILDESPRWLLTQDKLSDLEKLVFKMAESNGVTLPQHYDVLAAASKKQYDIDSKCSSVDNGKHKIRFWHLLRTPNLRKKTLILTWVWMANAIVYVGLQFNVENLPGNKYFTFSILGLIEFPAACFNWLILDKVGRILPAFTTMVIGGMASVATFFWIERITYLETIILVGCTKFCISSSYSIVYQVSGELFPTEARATGIGFGSVMANIGILTMPYIIASARTLQMLPMLIMGLLSFSGGIMTLFLPETLRENLPESLYQAETHGKVGIMSLKRNITLRSISGDNAPDRVQQ